MDKEYLVRVCLAVYRVTEIFPGKEPLKFDIREKANQILADLLLFKNQKNPEMVEKKRILGNIEVLNGYFEIAKAQRWVDERNFFVLRREYDKIKKEISSIKKKKNPDSSDVALNDLTNERYKKILEILRQKERVQVWEFKKIFPQVSKRTLRRNLDYLIRQGLVQRVGDRNDTYYKLGRTG
ncbi:DeoR family transcriptional regulator [bacterium]|nr:DeoR family transcriptional regulator [bacterium]